MNSSNVARFLFEVEGLQAKLQVAELSGHEGISSHFDYHITLVSEDHELEFADVMGYPGHLTFFNSEGDMPVAFTA